MHINVIFILCYVPLASLRIFMSELTKGSWDDEDYPRMQDKHCECGIYEETKTERPWTMFVSKKDEHGLRRLCTGTIITSNLLATSHECLQLTSKRFHVYDIWKPKGGTSNMIDESQLIISKDPSSPTSSFRIVQIIYNHRFGIHVATKSGPADNLVLIQVEPHFTNVSKGFSPICIPQCGDPVSDLRHQFPYFLGLLDTLSGRAWEFSRGCPEGPGHTTTSTTPAPPQPPATLPPPGSVTGDIVDEDHCDSADDDIEEEDEPLLCFRQTSGKPPKWGDGTLILDSVSDDHRSFLVGTVASRVGTRMWRSGDEGVEYILFNKISGLIRYIEYHAARVGSRWCHSGKLILGKLITPGATYEADIQSRQSENPKDPHTGRAVGMYIWDNPSLTISPRDETLNCVCGVKSTGGASGRIIGGETAQQHEYPWLTFIENYIYPRSSHPKPATCTGQIINDLIVITAGHCVEGKVYNFTTKAWERVMPAPPDRFEVYVNAHFTPAAKKDDPKMIRRKVYKVYVFPDYDNTREDYTIANHSVDIAMLLLDKPVPFDSCGDGARPICVPRQMTPELKLAGIYAEIAGWGRTGIVVNQTTGVPSATGEPPTELQKASIQILGGDACNRVNHHANPRTERGLCTGNVSSLSNTFQGDSGGPLMVKLDGLEQYTLVGTVSAGYPYPTQWMLPDSRKRRELPPLTHFVWYTPVQKFVRWIDYISNLRVFVETKQKMKVHWCKSSI